MWPMSVICEWVEWDFLHLKRIHISVNLADLFTKHLTPALFYRHTDYVLGHVPPHYAPVPSSPAKPTAHKMTTTWTDLSFFLANVYNVIN